MILYRSSFKDVCGRELNNILSKLNAVQRAAIARCLVTNDYVMILGWYFYNILLVFFLLKVTLSKKGMKLLG